MVKMASWKDDQDILRDMDKLSGIQSPGRKIKSYTSWGRGQNLNSNVHDNIDTFAEPQSKSPQEEYEWNSKQKMFGKFPDSISRGKKLEYIKENCHQSLALEVQEQLRAAMGPGHSNAFIEASFKQQFGLKSDQKKSPSYPQFEDSEAVQAVHSSSLNDGESSGNKVVVGQSESMSEPMESTFSPQVEEHMQIKSRRRKQRRYRNACLESIERMNSGIVSIENEHGKTDSPMTAVKAGPMFGSKTSNIPPACYFPGRSQAVQTSYLTKEAESPFVYSESEFPKL